MAPRAFTLVELLVVIAIIGLLVALLLPAVQAAREAARRTHCQQNLREIGTALLNYEGQHKELPIGCIGYNITPGVSPVKQKLISWNVQLLPFLEQQALYDRFRLDLPAYEQPNRELGSALLAIYLCPSTPSEQLFSTATLWRGQAFTDYAGLFGVEGEGHDNPDFGDPQVVDPNTQPLHEKSLGVMVYNVAVTFNQIIDGTSHTAAVGEALLRRETVISLANGDKLVTTSMEWPNGHNVFAQEANTGINLIGLDNEIGSPHPGGAQVTFCDGHVEFLSDDTEQNVLNALLTRQGGEVL